MSEYVRLAAVLAGVGFLTAFASAPPSEPTSPPAAAPSAPAQSASSRAPTAAADSDEKALFETTCSACHDLSLATQQQMSRSAWQGTVAEMVGMGAPLTDQQAAEVTDYLARHYGTG